MHEGTICGHILTVDLQGLEAIDRTMGASIVDAALPGLGRLIERHIGQSVRAFDDTAKVRAARRGRWEAFFNVPAPALTGEDDDPVIALLAALRQMVNEATIDIFGAATASIAQAAVVARRASGDDPLEESLAEAARTGSVDLGTRAALMRTLRLKEIRTVLQPIVSLQGGEIVGVEALTRGREGGPFERADQLFAAAARSGLSTALEILCIQQALPFLERLPAPLFLSVNASAPTIRQLYGGSMPGHRLSPRLIVELTEHLAADEVEDLPAIFRRLRSGGTRVALDDAGCGYVSLDTVGRLKPDIVKLCQTVTRHMDRDDKTLMTLTRTVIRLRAMGHQILAEGIETAAQARLMRALGVDLAQGWFFGRPVPAEEFDVLYLDKPTATTAPGFHHSL